MLISDNSPVRKIISILTLYRMRMQGYCDVYKWTISKRTSPEVKSLHPTSSRREMCTFSVSNVIYHKFAHWAAFYTLNGKNVKVMLELIIIDGDFSNFSLKPYIVTPCLNHLDETVQMRSHNIHFYAELTKIIPNYHQILLIKSSA